MSETLKQAVEWVLKDASYKAPEQVGEVGEKWIARLQGALGDNSPEGKDKELEEELSQLAGFQEDYPDQFKEARRRMVVERALELADGILTGYSDGSTEELDWMTGRLVELFFEKVMGRLQSKLLARDLESRTLR